MKQRINVLITGAGSTMGYSVYKALMKSKFAQDVNVTFTNSEVDGPGFFLSPTVNNCYIVPVAKDKEYIPTLLNICKKEKIDILFSGTEHEIFELSKNIELFKKEAGTLVMLSDLNVIAIGTDKYKTAKFFKENDIPFPETVLFDDYQELIDKVGFPIFMKPRTASASRNIFRINSIEELHEKKFATSSEIILQTYLDSEIEYTVETFVDSNGEICGTIPMRRELGFGLSVSGIIDDNSEAIQVSEKIAKALKPTGPVNIQLRMVDGKAIPFEINTRFSSTECVRANYGYNSIEASIEHYLFNKDVKLNYTKGMFMRYWEECYFTEDEYLSLIHI